MALELNLDFELTKKDGELQLAIFDYTGDYISGVNDTGFGAPNPDITDVVDSSLAITFPDGTTVTYVSTTILPEMTGVWQYLTSADITGTAGAFVDGLYKILYTVNTATESFTFTADKLFYPTICCWLDQQFAAFSFPICTPCEGEQAADLCELLMAWGMLESLKAQACLGLTDKFNNTLTLLNKIMNVDTNCNNC